MPQALPVFGKWLIGKTLGALIVRTALINLALGALSKLLTKQPRGNRSTVPPVNVTIRNPVEQRRLLFGTVRASGVVAFYDVSGTDSMFLWYVVVYSGHQCADIRDVWIETQRVADADINGGAAAGGAVTTGPFANKLWIYKHLGTSSQTSNIPLTDAFSVTGTWTGDHRLRGCAYIVVKMQRDDEVFPSGAPQNVTALIDGALLYDPRLDSTNGGSGSHRRDNPTTWAFSRNPALEWRWYVSGGSVHNDVVTRLIKYGLRESDSRIPDAYVAAAANICDESISGSIAPPSGTQPRYRGDIEVSCGEPRRDIIEHILATMAGTHVPVHGQHRVFAGAYDTPTHAFTELDLYGQLEVEDTVDHGRRYNAVAAVFRDAGKQYVEQTTPFRTSASYETQDGGKRIPLEIDLRGVSDQYQAQRLCEIKLRKSRMMRSVKLVGALNLLKVALNETLTYSHARYTWSNRVFRCLERQLEFGEDAGRTSLTCQREDAAVYTDMVTADYTTGTSASDAFTNETPDAPTNLHTTGLQNGILVEWNRPTLMYAGTAFEARESASSAMTSPTTVYQGPDLQFLIGKLTTASYYYQVRSIRNGQPSAWEPASAGVLGRASSVAAALSASVAPGSASSSSGAASQTTNSVTVTPAGGTTPYTYAWTWASGGTSITINSATAATTTFGATGLTEGETRSGQARCTVTDNVSATYTVDVSVSITRPAPTVTAPTVVLYDYQTFPTDASVSFTVDADGYWYGSGVLWCNPVDYAGNYKVRVTRTGGTETAFTSGPALGTFHDLTIDRTWVLTNTGLGTRDIIYTIDIARISDSVIVSTTTLNKLGAIVESGA